MLLLPDWPHLPSAPVGIRELSDDDTKLISRLYGQIVAERKDLELDLAYYLGEQIVQNLRIAVPEQLEFLRTVLGWGTVPVDPIVERLAIDGFRLPGGTDVDEELVAIWDANGMDAHQSMLWTDALVMRAGYLMVGSRPGGGTPLITVESPLNTAVDWAPDGVTARSVLTLYSEGDKQRASLLRPNSTIVVEKEREGKWSVVSHDQHALDIVPVERVANRALTHLRGGRSEITKPMRDLIDGTARTLLGQVVSGEIYAAPRWAILGATESDFVDASGRPKSSWATYVTRILGLERDEEGNLPAIHQFQAYDPSTFTKIVEMNASQFAGMSKALPQELGLYTQGNPTSSEALEVGEFRRNRRAKVGQREFGVPVVRTMQHAIRFMNNGRLPEEFERIKPDWVSLSEPTINGVSDGLAKQVEAQMIPATSDVTLKRAGYSAVERAQLAQDRLLNQGQRVLDAIADQGNGDADAAG